MADTPIVKVKFTAMVDLPQYAHTTDSGADLVATESYTLSPGETHVFNTGISIELPDGYEAQVRSKSGRAAKESLFVLNSPGTVDNGYRGEVKVILHNASPCRQTVNAGEKIAQLVIAPYVQAQFVVADLTETDRGEGGLGSTGLNLSGVTTGRLPAGDPYHGTEDGRGPDFADRRRE